MKDQFEKYVARNRQKFDHREPDAEHLWSGVQQQLGMRKAHHGLTLWRAAAILLAFVAVAQFTYILTDARADYRQNQTFFKESENGAFESLEASYRQEMQLLEQKLAEKKVNPAEHELFYEKLKYMEEVENEFKQEIPLANDRQKLASILIDTYEKKIRLLERLLQQVEREERLKKELKEGMMPLKHNDKTMAI